MHETGSGPGMDPRHSVQAEMPDTLSTVVPSQPATPTPEPAFALAEVFQPLAMEQPVAGVGGRAHDSESPSETLMAARAILAQASASVLEEDLLVVKDEQVEATPPRLIATPRPAARRPAQAAAALEATAPTRQPPEHPTLATGSAPGGQEGGMPHEPPSVQGSRSKAPPARPPPAVPPWRAGRRTLPLPAPSAAAPPRPSSRALPSSPARTPAAPAPGSPGRTFANDAQPPSPGLVAEALEAIERGQARGHSPRARAGRSRRPRQEGPGEERERHSRHRSRPRLPRRRGASRPVFGSPDAGAGPPIATGAVGWRPPWASAAGS